MVGSADSNTGNVIVTLTATGPGGDPRTVMSTAPSQGKAVAVEKHNGAWLHVTNDHGHVIAVGGSVSIVSFVPQPIVDA